METEPVLESKAAVDSTLDDASYDHNTEGEPTESAHEWLETRFGMLPDSSFAWFRAGVGFYNKALHEFAIDCLSEAVQIDPNNFNAFQILARSFIALNRRAEAIACLKKSVALDNASDWQLLAELTADEGGD